MSTVLISQTDTDGIIIFANREFCEFSGYTFKELVGKNHNILRSPDMPSSIFKKMWSALKDSQHWNGLIKNLRKDGSHYWVDVEIIPMIDEKNEITSYICTQKEASKKSIDENEALNQKRVQTQG